MSRLNVKNQSVFIGDNLDIMRGLNSVIADLIATNLPFNRERRLDHVFGTNPKTKRAKPSPVLTTLGRWTMSSKEEHEILNQSFPQIYHLCSLAHSMHSRRMTAYLIMMRFNEVER